MAITGAQIRAARAFLRMTAQELALAANIGVATVRRAEATDGIPSITGANLDAIRKALEAAGLNLIAENGGGPGVRLNRQP